MIDKTIYDVVICGGGFAGLCLARQLKLKDPNLSVLVLEKRPNPLPLGTFKVGESTTEITFYYLGEILELKDYFTAHHVKKLGLRFFYEGGKNNPFWQRPEMGLSRTLPPYGYHLDRGLLENDLRRLNQELGVEIRENCAVKDIKIQPEQYQEIIYKDDVTKQTQKIQSRWVVDSMGRRRFLQKKLGLTRPNNSQNNAVWFRLEGTLDISKFVPETEQEWHERIPNNERYLSTNHLVGQGYWVWIIILATGLTSIGIVAKETIHPFNRFNTYEKALSWLEKNEPELFGFLRDKSPLDFMKMPHYSYSSKQVYSAQRWACVGEAGVFLDPLYSLGGDMIAFSNTLVTDLIEQDLKGELTQKAVDNANLFLLTYNDQLTHLIRVNYELFGHNSLVVASKLLWDVLAGWLLNGPQIFNLILVKPDLQDKIRKISGNFFLLNHRVQNLLQEWSEKSRHLGSFEFIDYLSLPFMVELRRRTLQGNKSEVEILHDYQASIELLEEFAQVIFLLALEDTMPEKLGLFPPNIWLNPWGMSLDVNKWQKDKLFEPKSQPRDYSQIMEQMRQNIKFQSLVTL